MSQRYSFIATCPKGLEQLLASEISALGAELNRETVGAMSFSADVATAYRICLWSRLANRVLLVLTEFRGESADALYDGLKNLKWDEHLSTDSKITVDFNGQSNDIRNTHFGALKSKDAIVDYFLASGTQRPSVDKENPDVRVNVRLRKGYITVAIDLSGESLHRRAYRSSGAMAPLKENLAAALLLRADWPGMASRGGGLIDPMCGSGTLLIEAAMMAMQIAPGLLRSRWGFTGWRGHDQIAWDSLLEEARALRSKAMAKDWPEIRGYDANGKVVAQAEENIDNAGLSRFVKVSRRELAQLAMPTHRTVPEGLLITNPPYGERLGEQAELLHLYRHLGQAMKAHFTGWQAAIFTGNPDLGKRMGVRSHKQYQLLNGTIPAKLLLFNINSEAFVVERDQAQLQDKNAASDVQLTAGGQMFANRLRKNIKRLSKWKNKNEIECYRVYDADMPEYAVAVDCYGSAVHIAEYMAPVTISEEDAERRLREVIEAVSQVFSVSAGNIAIKERRRQRGKDQYQRQAPRNSFMELREGQAKILVNLFDYLDTGLFLDHRPVRLDIAARAKGKRFLNLFSYTGVASVQAGIGGARFTTSVDMSRTYLQWARRNLSLNGLSEARHRTEHADCRKWLKSCEDQYDLVLLDPPTFSNSKRMDDVLDTQRDHGELIDDTMRCLAVDGLLIFSTNKRDFSLDESVAEKYQIEDKTRWSLDEDFSRAGKPIHYCWYIRHR
ncbi:bifunctional 23S rRNA (guanine(2069)-N(7))-methyltransferase RlmK/23S rRNA (guanine(2445)-N(2))-methyltransferase RlmL [Zhongshania aquimaris]|uniref:Ribosomal RNA large subunit methyltransferase K/L n=1 Tax=Zhongshania aquimaris TaxID=2857107 RepID=A0ABS6VLW1_9GAMM|nr:bifunctional 23S rRNA (guanine(2069)-N(7))-methyltransferase RlmK/23S rRNA (guanine(2445)-N(2))-methyltransferase RlmL [Zhongshania aquimaris]MBW2939297.1 bifunctional 23S rRNA (guanine(2069)-N(7))-methyltransferase RlmK/23S rRNA (guanine(2445)-N(2))-methyltransferase RlmL [Zhongshania aquimaris]